MAALSQAARQKLLAGPAVQDLVVHFTDVPDHPRRELKWAATKGGVEDQVGGARSLQAGKYFSLDLVDVTYADYEEENRALTLTLKPKEY